MKALQPRTSLTVERPRVSSEARPRPGRRRSTVASAAAAGAPSRGVVILPGLGNAAGDYAAIAALRVIVSPSDHDLGFHVADDLKAHGLAVTTARVARWNWLRNAAGLADLNYWRGTLQPRPTVDWYMNHMQEAVEESRRQTDGGPVTLLAHSAGGWLARVYLLSFGTEGIDRLVTLGSPHNPPPRGVIDQTRGILTYVQQSCPGNFHQEVAYVTIAGKYVKGAALTDGSATWGQKIAGAGYQQVCGRADVWGDGITPVETAHLPGAKQLTLDGVFHSPLGSSPTSGDGETPGRPWYGSPGVLEQWIQQVERDVEELTEDTLSVGDIMDASLQR